MPESEPWTSSSRAPDPHELEQAARAWGVETEYWDVWGQHHRASPQVEAAILTSLGVDATSKSALDRALEEREWRAWRTFLPATIVLSIDRAPHELPLSIPVELANAHLSLEIRYEDGSDTHVTMELGEVAVLEHACVEGRNLVRKRIRLPDSLPLGYHRLAIEIGGMASEPSRLIVCPSRAYQPPELESGRAAGLAISLYGLRSARN